MYLTYKELKMKLLSLTLLILLNTSLTNANESCALPKGEFTSLEMVLNQFVFNNGNPNWGDWCYEGTLEESNACNNELNQWDKWVECKDSDYLNHCVAYAEKEGHLTGANVSEYTSFITKCVADNFQALLK